MTTDVMPIAAPVLRWSARAHSIPEIEAELSRIWASQDLTPLKTYCEKVAKAVDLPIPKNYPVVGSDAFRTATGVHAAAIIKAFKKQDIELANTVYSGVPSQYFGLEQIIDIGPMSGKSNVLYWLEKRGIPCTEELVEAIYKRAKQSDRTLTEADVLDVVASVQPPEKLGTESH